MSSIDLTEDPLARPFRLDGSGTGACLLVHGFTGTPDELRPLGMALHERGLSVRAPLLPGHGTRVEDLATTLWTDWYAHVTSEWDELRHSTQGPHFFVAGLSMGCLLTIHLAHERRDEMAAIALLSPAIDLANQSTAELSTWLGVLPWIPPRFEIMPKEGRKGRKSPAYDAIPIRAVASMMRLQRQARAELPAIKTPTIVLVGEQDATISDAAGSIVFDTLGGETRRLSRFPLGTHVLTEGEEGSRVVEEVVAFFAAHMGG